MARRSFTEGTWRSDPLFQDLCKAIAACATPEEIADFLRDIGTLSELKAWSERWEVAKLIRAGQTYRAITERTGASTTTVTRVGSFLQDGVGGYERVLNRLGHHRHSQAPAKGGRRR